MELARLADDPELGSDRQDGSSSLSLSLFSLPPRNADERSGFDSRIATGRVSRAEERAVPLSGGSLFSALR